MSKCKLGIVYKTGPTIFTFLWIEEAFYLEWENRNLLLEHKQCKSNGDLSKFTRDKHCLLRSINLI